MNLLKGGSLARGGTIANWPSRWVAPMHACTCAYSMHAAMHLAYALLPKQRASDLLIAEHLPEGAAPPALHPGGWGRTGRRASRP